MQSLLTQSGTSKENGMGYIKPEIHVKGLISSHRVIRIEDGEIYPKMNYANMIN